MKPKVYLETTILGYLTPMRVDAANLEQALRRKHAEAWWSTASDRFQVFISAVVVTEARLGRNDLAQRRLQLIKDLPSLPIADESVQIAQAIMSERILPDTAARDALHIGVAAWEGMDFLVTYNFKHIDNPAHVHRLEAVVRRFNVPMPVLCSPLDLLHLPS